MSGNVWAFKSALMLIKTILTVMSENRISKNLFENIGYRPAVTPQVPVDASLPLPVPLVDGEDGVGDGVETVELVWGTFQA